MILKFDALHVPKAGSTADQYEDAFACAPESGLAAVSDGAGTAFESGRWARLLTSAFVERPPTRLPPERMLDWVDSVAAEWVASIPWSDLTVFEEAKAASGSAGTLVGLDFWAESMYAQAGWWRCLALGDSCLFRVAQGRLVTALPIKKSVDFDSRPPLFYTRRAASERDIARLTTVQGTWRRGDQFLLLTDAIAAWFLREVEQGRQPWETLNSVDKGSFESFVELCRDQRLMRNNDVTVLRLTADVPRRLSTAPGHVPAPTRWSPVGVGGGRECGDYVRQFSQSVRTDTRSAKERYRRPVSVTRVRHQWAAVTAMAFICLALAIALGIAHLVQHRHTPNPVHRSPGTSHRLTGFPTPRRQSGGIAP